jgi:hypothetical protein
MEPAFDERTYANTFGIAKKADRDLAEALVSALQQLDRALLPPAATHPLASLIAEGPRGVDRLLSLVEGGDARQKADALDALAHVLLGAPQKEAAGRLKKQLAQQQEPELAALLAKTLAIAGDEDLLVEQLRRLADDDPGVVAAAARLLGFGRYRPAVPALKGLVSPERFYESRWVIWALGEIGDRDALPALEIALSHAFRVVDCLIAIGKIGELTSIPSVTPHLMQGLPEQKDAAVRALAMILDKNREQAGKVLATVRSTQMKGGPLSEQLSSLLEAELGDPDAKLSASTRFHMLLCLARLGHKLDAARLRMYLGAHLEEKELRHVGSLVSPFNRVKQKR